jgi:DNA-binding NtrC family response regulator
MSALPTNLPMPCSGGVFIASPSRALREQVVRRLDGRCRPVLQAAGGAEALAVLERGDCQVLFLDRHLPDLDADELIVIIGRRLPGIQVVLLDSDPPAPAETEPGAEDIATAHSCPALPERPDGPKLAQAESLPGMIGTSTAMQQVYRMARLVAPRTTTVLVAGPTGSGKELVAKALHALSPRAAKPFVVVNCAAIPEALLESELFGYARGAFTGAVRSQLGRIPAAQGGTLFLDEVSEVPLGMQAKLLRFIEQKEVQRLGTCETTQVDVRVLAASNVDLASRIGHGQFREDLFYRLSAFPITLPALRERRSDIVPLAEHFLARMAVAWSTPCPRLSAAAARILESHPWNGNVRELQHVMERASILAESGNTILAEHLYFPDFSARVGQTGAAA